MSVKIIEQTWGFGGHQLSIGAKLTLLALAEFADTEGVCWPSVAQIRKKTGLSRSHTLRCLARLQECGFVTVDSSRGRGIRNVYVVHPKRSHPETFYVEEKVSSVRKKGLNRVPQKVSSVGRPLHSKEPSYRTVKEPSEIRWLQQRYERGKAS